MTDAPRPGPGSPQAEAPHTGSPHTGSPHVIVVLTDQQRWDTTGVHGNPADVTPEFDRMARAGTHVEHAITPQPVCAPARAALQTGRWPTATGVFHNGLAPDRELPTLASSFAAAGYTTGYLGKWHLAAEAGGDGPVPAAYRMGYTHWLASELLEFTSDAYRTVLHDEDGEPVRLPGYRSDALFDAAIRFVADHGEDERPFLLFVSLLEPHHQNATGDHPAPEGYAERYAGTWLPPDLAALAHGASDGGPHRHLGGYLGQVKRLDEGLGRLRDALRSMGLEDRTVLAWTSDHGSHFRTRNDEFKRSAHEASVRVPLALTGPGFTGGGRIRRPVSTLDLVPTLMEAAGVPVPASVQGRSLLPLVGGGDDPGRPEEVFIQISESHVGRAVRTSRWKYAVRAPEADPWNEPGACRYTESELYDLDADPYELTNLAGLTSHRQIAEALRESLLRRMEHAGEKRPVIEPAPEREGAGRGADPEVRALPWEGVRFGHHAHTTEPTRGRTAEREDATPVTRCEPL